MSSTFESIAAEVLDERARQEARWGEQNHPDGTGPGAMPLYSGREFLDDSMTAARLAELMRKRTERRFDGHHGRSGTWADILLEEVFEALAEDDPVRLCTELIQVAAVAQQWVAAIDRRTTAA